MAVLLMLQGLGWEENNIRNQIMLILSPVSIFTVWERLSDSKEATSIFWHFKAGAAFLRYAKIKDDVTG